MNLRRRTMKLTRLTFCIFVITLALSMGLVPYQVEALSVDEVEALWTTDVDPRPWSDHTRCDAVFAKGQNWVYFDWAQTSESKQGIFLLDGTNAVPVVNSEYPELLFSPRVLYHDEQFYLTYRKTDLIDNPPEDGAYAVFLKMSSDGINFGPAEEIYRPDNNGWIGTHDIIFAQDWFYLAYFDFTSGDIFVVKSRDLNEWTTPEPAAATDGINDFAPDLCWARGKIWLAWDYTSSGLSTVWITNSHDGVTWAEPVEIPPTDPHNEVWGPFSLIWFRGQFILATRARHQGQPFTQRITYTTSKDGIKWTEYTLVTSPSCDPDYDECMEKGSVIFPILGDGISHGLEFAIVFKRLQWYYSSIGERLFYGGIYRAIISG
jgi:hypothetical protein